MTFALSCWALALAAAWLAARALGRDAALAARLGVRAETGRRAWRLGLAIAALGLLGAAAWPAGEAGEKGLGSVPEPVVFVLDASRSMLAEDASATGESRLAVAAKAIDRLMDGLPGGEFAVAAFAGEGAAIAPLTRDREAIATLVASARIGEAPGAGSSLAAGLDAAALLARSRPRYSIVLLSDGEALSGDAAGAARRARSHGAIVSTVTVGGRQGARLPLPGGGLVTWRGEPVVSKADPDAMAAIAAAGGGKALAGAEPGALARLAAEVPKRAGTLGAGAWSDRARLALEGALALLLLDFALAARWPRFRAAPALAALVLSFALFGAAGLPGWLTDWRVDAAWRGGRPAEARARLTEALRTRPDDARLRYDRGLAAMAVGRFDEAAADFAAAAAVRDPAKRAQARYNEGNARFRAAEASPAQARARYREAVAAYEKALADAPADADARHNLELARRRLASPPPPEPPKPSPTPSPAGGSGTQPPPLPSGMRQPSAAEAETILKALEADERRQSRAEAERQSSERAPVSDWERDW